MGLTRLGIAVLIIPAAVLVGYLGAPVILAAITAKHNCNSITLAAQMRLMGRGEGYNVGYMTAQEDCRATIRGMQQHDKPVDHAGLGGPGEPAR